MITICWGFSYCKNIGTITFCTAFRHSGIYKQDFVWNSIERRKQKEETAKTNNTIVTEFPRDLQFTRVQFTTQSGYFTFYKVIHKFYTNKDMVLFIIHFWLKQNDASLNLFTIGKREWSNFFKKKKILHFTLWTNGRNLCFDFYNQIRQDVDRSVQP